MKCLCPHKTLGDRSPLGSKVSLIPPLILNVLSIIFSHLDHLFGVVIKSGTSFSVSPTASAMFRLLSRLGGAIISFIRSILPCLRIRKATKVSQVTELPLVPKHKGGPIALHVSLESRIEGSTAEAKIAQRLVPTFSEVPTVRQHNIATAYSTTNAHCVPMFGQLAIYFLTSQLSRFVLVYGSDTSRAIWELTSERGLFPMNSNALHSSVVWSSGAHSVGSYRDISRPLRIADFHNSFLPSVFFESMEKERKSFELVSYCTPEEPNILSMEENSSVSNAPAENTEAVANVLPDQTEEHVLDWENTRNDGGLPALPPSPKKRRRRRRRRSRVDVSHN